MQNISNDDTEHEKKFLCQEAEFQASYWNGMLKGIEEGRKLEKSGFMSIKGIRGENS